MQNAGIIKCCNYEQRGRIYNIADNCYLIFTDECPVCGNPIAEIRSRNSKGEFVTTLRRAGDSAIRLYDKYCSRPLSYDCKVHTGTRAKEYSFTNKYGIVYNGNGVKIAEQDKFLDMSREEVNAILNKRFYKSKAIRK